jgi:formylglycine-generating enzyme required for sulfatase activity
MKGNKGMKSKLTLGRKLILISVFALSVVGCKSTNEGKKIVTIPNMVYIPSGNFIQGDMSSSNKFASPVRTVKIKSFLISATEVTVSQWSKCVQDKKCSSLSYGQEDKLNHPVMGVTYEEAMQFINWLSVQTGKSFRLPSESEWEYAAKGGRAMLYGISNKANRVCRHANVMDEEGAKIAEVYDNVFSCSDHASLTSKVKSYIPNLFGLYDMLGNVSEITQDCWNNNYQNSPKNGTSWNNGDCKSRVIRGGSYLDGPNTVNTFSRKRLLKSDSDTTVGFRVAISSESGLLKFLKSIQP